MIHPTAVVHAGARLGQGVEVGPFVVIDENVVVGDGCRLGPGVYLTGHTTIGRENQIHAGAVLGDAPQDLKYRHEPTRLIIGDRNVFREHVTVHRSAKLEEATEIGSHCLLMAGSHVGHNCRLGDHVILANGALLGGHVRVEDRVFISGNCLVHQFVTIGTLAMMQGGAAISLDLPPFCMAAGVNELCGLNTIGLRRAGISSDQRLELRRLYHALFRRRGRLRDAISSLAGSRLAEPARRLLEFASASKRGVCRVRRGAFEATGEAGE
jgi:UDP-N-acetylglucosamine acyltransferase